MASIVEIKRVLLVAITHSIYASAELLHTVVAAGMNEDINVSLGDGVYAYQSKWNSQLIARKWVGLVDLTWD